MSRILIIVWIWNDSIIEREKIAVENQKEDYIFAYRMENFYDFEFDEYPNRDVLISKIKKLRNQFKKSKIILLLHSSSPFNWSAKDIYEIMKESGNIGCFLFGGGEDYVYFREGKEPKSNGFLVRARSDFGDEVWASKEKFEIKAGFFNSVWEHYRTEIPSVMKKISMVIEKKILEDLVPIFIDTKGLLDVDAPRREDYLVEILTSHRKEKKPDELDVHFYKRCLAQNLNMIVKQEFNELLLKSKPNNHKFSFEDIPGAEFKNCFSAEDLGLEESFKEVDMHSEAVKLFIMMDKMTLEISEKGVEAVKKYLWGNFIRIEDVRSLNQWLENLFHKIRNFLDNLKE